MFDIDMYDPGQTYDYLNQTAKALTTEVTSFL